MCLTVSQQAYKAVNQQFADAIQDIYRDGDMVRQQFTNITSAAFSVLFNLHSGCSVAHELALLQLASTAAAAAAYTD
jgi:hypothetical protein